MIREMARNRPGFTWVTVVSLVELISVVIGVGSPLQPLLSVVFTMTCPGLLLLDMDEPKDIVARIMLGIGGSIGANILVVTLVLVTDAGPLAPVLFLGLAVLAVLPKDRLASGIAKIQALRPTPEAMLDAPAPQAPSALAEDGSDEADSPMPATEDSTPTEQIEEPPDRAKSEVPSQSAEPEAPTQSVEPEYPPSVLVLGVDINRAGAGPLTGLPGVGTGLAARIVDHRDEHGPFADVHALLDLLRGMAIEEEARKL